MSKLNLSNVARQIGGTIRKKSPEILTGMGIGLGFCTVGLAVKATPRALMLIEEKKREINRDILEEAKANGHEICNHVDKLTPVDTVKVAWKCYIPAATTGVASIVCLVSANSISARRNAALLAAYTISETALKDYRNKVVEVVGEKKEREVQDAVAIERFQRDPVENKEIVITNKGKTRCYDVLTGRYFESDIDSINRAVNEYNRELITQPYMSLNEFYEKLELPDVELGNYVGWRVDWGLVEVRFTSKICETDNVPYAIMSFVNPPAYGYDDLLS